MFEAAELRDNDDGRYCGKGVINAVENINTEIYRALLDCKTIDQARIDSMLISLDGTDNKSRLGANAILAVSLALAKASAAHYRMPLHRYIGGISADILPVPMMNILNGGAHADNALDVQEFMLVPIGAPTFKECMRMCTEIYHSLAKLLRAEGLSTAVGDEGGFAPQLTTDAETLELIMAAGLKAGYEPRKHFALAMDAAASEWKSGETGKYTLPKSKKEYTSAELIAHWEELAARYPLISLEDGLDEEDFDGWKLLTERLGDKLQLVGDDLFVTNVKRLKDGIKGGYANAILIKPNQIGTVSEALEAIKTAKRAGYNAIVSHRSGETEDSFIADLAVAANCGQIKTGAPCRSERVAKYNRLLRIEGQLGGGAEFMGTDYFLTARGGKAE